jgi:hypothetical protein
MSKKEGMKIFVAFCELSSYFAMFSRAVETKQLLEFLKLNILQVFWLFVKTGTAYAI